MSKIIYIPKIKRNDALPKPFYRYSFNNDDSEDSTYWFKNFFDTNDRQVVLYIENNSICDIVYRVQYNKNTKNSEVYIHNFQVPNILYRGKSFGTKVLKETEKRIINIKKKSEAKITRIMGFLSDKDFDYCTISMPMYLKFAKAVMGENIVCKINDEPIDTNSLVNIIQKHIDNKIAVNFEFCREN